MNNLSWLDLYLQSWKVLHNGMHGFFNTRIYTWSWGNTTLYCRDKEFIGDEELSELKQRFERA